MSKTGISAVDHAPQVVAEWLNQINAELGWEEHARSYLLMRATLHALRDWLSVDEAADLSAQLPLLIRGIYFDGWNPSDGPARPRGKADFLGRVAETFDKYPLEDPEAAVRAVFTVLRNHVSEGEIAQVVHALRGPLRNLWT